MRAVTLFVAGIVVGTAFQTLVAQVQPGRLEVRLNHVGFAVDNVSDTLTYFNEKFGFREVAKNTNPQGQVMSAYVQVSRDTFLELQQANAERPAGRITHFGFETPNIKNTVTNLRQRGLMASDPTDKPSQFSGGYLANIPMVAGLERIELTEQPEGGKLRQATESWK